MAIIDSRLKDCDTDQDVTENFNRIINLIDKLSANSIPDNLIIITKDNSTIELDSVAGTITITNKKLYDAVQSVNGTGNFKVLFIDASNELNVCGLSYGESGGNGECYMYFDSAEASTDKYLFTATETPNEVLLTLEDTITYTTE